MPEGHTLFRLAAELREQFGGQTVRVSSPQGRFADSALILDGSTLVGAESYGKHLFVEFSGDRFVHVHLGLYGKFDVRVGPAPAPVGQVRLRVVGDRGYADLRGATTCELCTAQQRHAVLGRLGPDPLRDDADWTVAWKRVSRSRAPIGGLLMDQAVLAGVGNVYRAEVLFRHRMHPLRPGNTVRRGQFEAMWRDIVTLMRYGVRTGRIDTVHEQHTPEAMGRDARVDDHGGEVYVYRRQGQSCHVCGSRIRTAELAGRNLFWCPRCQPKFRSRATVG
jgi:DNA-formamidopyrimidine glycosylase